MAFSVVHLDDLERAKLDDSGAWRPVRRALELTGVAANAYTAERAGDPLIEPHDELSPGAGGHEELYVVLSGAAEFRVGDETIAAPAGTMLRIDVGDKRSATATEPETTVLVAGARPGAAFPPSPFEYWYAAQPAYDAGDYARAIEIASEGLEHYAEHGGINYQLACYHALAGDLAMAAQRLEIAFASDPRTRGWAATDPDLKGVAVSD